MDITIFEPMVCWCADSVQEKAEKIKEDPHLKKWIHFGSSSFFVLFFFVDFIKKGKLLIYWNVGAKYSAWICLKKKNSLAWNCERQSCSL